MKIETIAVHAGRGSDAATGAVSSPIHLSTTFERDAEGNYPQGYIYSRTANPNRTALESALATIEGGSAAAAFSSGLAAASAVFQALAPGDHVLLSADTYHGTAKLARDLFAPWGMQFDIVDTSKPDDVKRALRDQTRLLWIETPSNPQLKITDIAAITAIGCKAGALSVCDNTWAPLIQRPLDLGADLVLHSTTKYFGGHSDVLGGALIAKTADMFFERIRLVQTTAGAVPAPFDCWLVHRGIQTLPWRMRAHCENAANIAHFLADHSAVEFVNYPGLSTSEGYEIAARQMSAFGGMLSFGVKGGRDAAMRVAARVKLFTRATSLGGVESLIEHRASIPGEDPRTPENLLRLSIGLENADDLIADLAEALA